MSKYKEFISETINLIDRIEQHMPKIDNIFDIFEKYNKIALDEGLIKSYNASFIINSLSKKFNLTNSINLFNNSSEYNGYIRIDYARNKPKNIEEFNKGGKPINEEIVILEIVLPEGDASGRVQHFMEACGWYSAYSETYGRKKGYILNVFEKRFQTNEGVKINSNNILYHLVPTSRLKKILKNGLCPKSGCKMGFHPERIYLFNEELSEREIYNWISQLSATENEKTIKDGYTLLQIDCSNLNIEFYADPNLDGAVYTTDNIPQQNIKILKQWQK